MSKSGSGKMGSGRVGSDPNFEVRASVLGSDPKIRAADFLLKNLEELGQS